MELEIPASWKIATVTIGNREKHPIVSAAAVRIDEFDENITFVDLKVYPTMGNGDLNRKEEAEGRK